MSGQAIRRHGRLIFLAAMPFLFFGGASVFAEELPADGETIQDDSVATIIVKGDIDERNSIIPVRPPRSIYGIEASVLDTPRAVSQINTEQLLNDAIRTTDDFVKYAPGINRGGGQNVSTTPQIRFQGSELFLDGHRLFNTRHPSNFNAYEGADIVSGPSSVVFGPVNATGGYVNYLAKQPHFDRNRTEITSRLGAWAPGKDRDTYKWYLLTVDNGGPITDTLAYRASVSFQDAEDYYTNINNDFNAYYVALAFQPSSNLRVDFNIAYDDYYNFDISHGWNRITQELVDNFGVNYPAGRLTPIVSSRVDGQNVLWSPVFDSGRHDSTVIGWEYRVRDDSAGYPRYVPDAERGIQPLATLPSASPESAVLDPGIRGYVLDPRNVHYINLTGDTYAREEDWHDTTKLTTNLKAEWEVSPTFSIRASSFYQRQNEAYDSVGNFQKLGRQAVAEQKLEFRLRNEAEIFGVDVRDDSNTGLIHQVNVFNALAGNPNWSNHLWDLSVDPAFKVPGLIWGVQPENFNPAGGQAGWIGTPGEPILTDFGYIRAGVLQPISRGLYIEPNGTGTVGGRWTTSTIFTQHNLLFAERVGFNVGASGSYLRAHIHDPSGAPSLTRERSASDDYGLFAVQVSPYLKVTPNSTVYVTYDRSRSLNANNQLSWGANDQLNALAFRSLSELTEIGVKFEPIPDQLFLALAAYSQARDQSPDDEGNISRIKTEGVEFQVRYQPDRNLATGLNLTTQQAEYERVRLGLAHAPNGVVVDNGTVINDAGRLNGQQPWASGLDVPGVPEFSASGFIRYTLDSGLGAELSGWWTSDWYTSTSKLVRIPSAFNLDLNIFYRRDNWDVALILRNITDEETFVSGHQSGDTFLQPWRPFTVQAQIGYRF